LRHPNNKSGTNRKFQRIHNGHSQDLNPRDFFDLALKIIVMPGIVEDDARFSSSRSKDHISIHSKDTSVKKVFMNSRKKDLV
jgi:hypothetical protein